MSLRHSSALYLGIKTNSSQSFDLFFNERTSREDFRMKHMLSITYSDDRKRKIETDFLGRM